MDCRAIEGLGAEEIDSGSSSQRGLGAVLKLGPIRSLYIAPVQSTV